MKTTGTLINSNLDFKNNKIVCTLELDIDTIEAMNELNRGKLSIEIKPYKPKRSLNANNYAWELITQIADLLRMSKEEVYIEMLKNYGQSDMISVLDNIDVSKFLKYYEKAGESILNGKNFIHYKVYTGSSEYDTKQMSILIDGIVQECHTLGIETKSKEEIESLKENWKENK